MALRRQMPTLEHGCRGGGVSNGCCAAPVPVVSKRSVVMKYLTILKELTVSEILSIVIVVALPLLIGYSLLT